MNPPLVNSLLVPPLLVELLQCGLWRHPGDEVMARVVPFLLEPVDFLDSLEKMQRESRYDVEDDPDFMREVRGSNTTEPVCFPCRDVERSFLIAVNRAPGADLGVALDFRSNPADPSVIVSDWWSESTGCVWREAASTFGQFTRALGLR